MMKFRKRCLFKNNFPGIKETVWGWRITNNTKKRYHLHAKQLEGLLNMALCIGIPRTEEEAARLKWICDKYKALNSEIESDLKQYIKVAV